MSGDANLRAAFLRDAATALDVDVVLELVHAAAEGDGSDISRWMLRLLSKLARHADSDSGPVAHRSDRGLRDQIKALLTGWDLENPNPEEYEEALAGMSSAAGEQPGEVVTRGEVVQIVERAHVAGHRVDEVLLLRIVHQVCERQHGERGDGAV